MNITERSTSPYHKQSAPKSLMSPCLGRYVAKKKERLGTIDNCISRIGNHEVVERLSVEWEGWEGHLICQSTMPHKLSTYEFVDLWE